MPGGTLTEPFELMITFGLNGVDGVMVTLEVVGATPFKVSLARILVIATPPVVPFGTVPESGLATIGGGPTVTVTVVEEQR